MKSIIEITGVRISNIDQNNLLSEITSAITHSKKLLISYANANTINLCSKNTDFKELLNSIFLVHPDGFGIYLASKILYKRNKFKYRFSGSDFYPLLANHSTNKGYKIYFFGHDISTLEKISSCYPELIINGYCEGYNYDTSNLINEINSHKPDILIIGLGQPVQEKWIRDNHVLLDTPIIIAVGDGIKVFAGEKKRGPEFMQKLGLEWLIRLFFNPLKHFNRYMVGNPVFLCRIIKAKLSKL